MTKPDHDWARVLVMKPGELRGESGPALENLAHCYLDMCDEASRVLAEKYAAIARAEKAEAFIIDNVATGKANELARERDEAHAECERLREALTRIHGTQDETHRKHCRTCALLVETGDGRADVHVAVSPEVVDETLRATAECNRCHECNTGPTLAEPCHPVEGVDDEGRPVFSCKHCPRVTPWECDFDEVGADSGTDEPGQ